ncbi:MAG: CehA/McbA family metallohydrolase, partial [bacterium]|nr:CehA/McbA family metallohydrolase [bacterium]
MQSPFRFALSTTRHDRARVASCVIVLLSLSQCVVGQDAALPIAACESQPLAANLLRLMDALDYLGSPLANGLGERVRAAAKLGADSADLQRLVDEEVLLTVSINPELRVKVGRGPAAAKLQQAGYRPCLVKLYNEATSTRVLRVQSPQAGPVYAGAAMAILDRQAQTQLAENENVNREQRFLALEMFDKAPMTPRLSGLEVEYLIVLIYAEEAGKREATIVFDLGQGTQDLGFRSEVPVLFEIAPAVPVKLRISDFDGTPTTARLLIHDQDARVYPPQAKRLAPDFFFQPQIYRASGDVLHLPPGTFQVTSCRGPEYLETTQELEVIEGQAIDLDVQLQRWIHPQAYGFYAGDHHIHGAGCSHYDNPTQGVTPADMFSQVKGEGLNVGCVLTWGPCFEHQRNFFSPLADDTSEPLTVLKYDLEISGFGSAAMGHVCLLNLRDQSYPGSEGTKIQGWPTWTVPVMAWAKQQGGFTGYPHSAIEVNPRAASEWLLQQLDRNGDQQLTEDEAGRGLLPQAFEDIDRDRNGQLSARELTQASSAEADELPNVALPGMDGGGAMEIFVSTPAGVCDFISAMDTARIPEWNTWYHLLNCGYPLKLSGETDFPCMSSRRVGQGRVYVQMGRQSEIDFAEWCAGLAAGESYVSDGYAHALQFSVSGQTLLDPPLALEGPQSVHVEAQVAFAPRQPKAVAYGTLVPAAGKRLIGDTVHLHAERETGIVEGGKRRVECVVNGKVVA